MPNIISQPAALCFSSDIDDIIFNTGDENGTLVLDVICNGTRVNVLEEIMYPDVDGHVSVCDLPSLLEAYAKRYLTVNVECSFTDEHATVNITPFVVLYANADVDTTASAFVANNFLSVLEGEKITAIGREERLHGYGINTVNILADVMQPAGTVVQVSATLNAMDTLGNVAHFDVSPENIISVAAIVNGELLGYTVTNGNRSQRFRVIEDVVPPAPSLMFINSFGLEEFIHCVGTHKKSSKYDRQSTRILGKLRNYRITEERQFTANTGWLNSAMADWADELFRSESVFLWVNGSVGREVVLSDSKSEIENDDDYMPAFEFTYTYAQRIHNVMNSGRVGRIFDNTFDRTFN